MDPDRKNSFQAEILTDLPAAYLRRLYSLPRDTQIWSQPDAVRDSRTRGKLPKLASKISAKIAPALLAFTFLISSPSIETSAGHGTAAPTTYPAKRIINLHHSGQFKEVLEWEEGTFRDGSPIIAGKFHSVGRTDVSGRGIRVWVVTERSNWAYFEYTKSGSWIVRKVKRWDHNRHRAAPYERGDYITAYFRATLRLLGSPIAFGIFQFGVLTLFFFERAGSKVLGTFSVPIVPVFLAAVLSILFFGGVEVVAQDERFREINAHLDSRRLGYPYFYPLDSLPEVKYKFVYYISGVILTIVHLMVPIYIGLRWAEIIHGFFYYATPDPRKRRVEAALAGDNSLQGTFLRPTRPRRFVNPAVLAAQAYKITKSLRADEEKQKAAAEVLKRETELMQAAVDRERARHALKFFERHRR